MNLENFDLTESEIVYINKILNRQTCYPRYKDFKRNVGCAKRDVLFDLIYDEVIKKR